MALYKYVQKLWKRPKESLGALWKERLIEWRRSPTITRIDKPTRIDRARALGYKAKKGFIIVRGRISRGGRKRKHVMGGRRSRHKSQRLNLKKSYQRVIEERVARKYPNLEVLNSYWVGKEGVYYFYEVILVDPTKKEIINDKDINWIVTQRGRVFRGLTSSGKNSRKMN